MTIDTNQEKNLTEVVQGAYDAVSTRHTDKFAYRHENLTYGVQNRFHECQQPGISSGQVR